MLSTLLRGEPLEAAETAWAMAEIMAGEASPAQLAAFAVLLRAKGETPAEHTGLVEAMLAAGQPVQVAGPLLDVVGTGGDRANTVNLSTMSALVAAGAGARVAKHGNRAASSSAAARPTCWRRSAWRSGCPGPAWPAASRRPGSASASRRCSTPGLRHASVPRREIGVPTAFNFLGPLANPARPAHLAVGCSDVRMAPIMAAVLAGRGDTALVFRGEDGLDELTTTTTSRVWVVRAGEVDEQRLDPADLGVPAVEREALRGGDAAYNAKVVRALLAGERGPVRDAVLLNAGAALAAYDGLREPLVDAVADGMQRAGEAIDSGAAADVLDRWVRVSQAAGRLLTPDRPPARRPARPVAGRGRARRGGRHRRRGRACGARAGRRARRRSSRRASWGRRSGWCRRRRAGAGRAGRPSGAAGPDDHQAGLVRPERLDVVDAVQPGHPADRDLGHLRRACRPRSARAAARAAPGRRRWPPRASRPSPH